MKEEQREYHPKKADAEREIDNMLVSSPEGNHRAFDELVEQPSPGAMINQQEKKDARNT